MNKVLYIILISLFSLTVISCAKKDDSSSSSSSSSGADESSLGANATSTCPGCIVLYIDKESLSKYKTDNYLLLDPFEGHRQNGLVTEDFEFYRESSSFPDMIDLGGNAVNDIKIIGLSEVNISFLLPLFCFFFIAYYGKLMGKSK